MKKLRWDVKVFIGAIFLLALIILTSNENKNTKEHDVSTLAKTAEQTNSTAPEKTEAEKIQELSNVDSWFYDRPNLVDGKLKKKLGKNAKYYKEIVSAAAYRIATRTGKKIDFSTSHDGENVIVDTDGGGRYEVEISDLKDAKGHFYNAESALAAPEIKTVYEKWIAKACANDYDITNVKNLLRKSSTYSSTVDVDWFTSEQDLGVSKDGTRELSVNFSNKNAFGVEVKYKATISISPKCTYKIKKLEKF